MSSAYGWKPSVVGFETFPSGSTWKLKAWQVNSAGHHRSKVKSLRGNLPAPSSESASPQPTPTGLEPLQNNALKSHQHLKGAMIPWHLGKKVLSFMPWAICSSNSFFACFIMNLHLFCHPFSNCSSFWQVFYFSKKVFVLFMAFLTLVFNYADIPLDYI